MTENLSGVQLGRVLANAAREVEVMAVKASKIDEAIGDMLVNCSAFGPQITLLQEVDMLRQSVDCIQILIDNLSRQELGDCQICPEQVGEGVYLEAIRRGCLDN